MPRSGKPDDPSGYTLSVGLAKDETIGLVCLEIKVLLVEPVKTIQDKVEDVQHIISLPWGVYRVSMGSTLI